MRSRLPVPLAALILAGVSCDAVASPRWLRTSWTGPTDTTLTISWTDDSTAPGEVEFGRQGATRTRTSVAAAPTGLAGMGSTYTATLQGLQPAATYEYLVRSAGGTSAVRTVRTAPAAGSCGAVRFTAGGDSRGEDVLFYTPSAQWTGIAAAMAAEQSHISIHTGDFVHDGEELGQWSTEMGRLEPLSRSTPFFMVLGNHDTWTPGAGAFNALFAYPADNPDRVEDYGALVLGRVLVVWLSTYTFDMDRQLDWLQGVLNAHRDDVDWRIVSFHTPVWSSGAHGSNENDKPRAGRLVPMLDQAGVDLVFNGHDHDYERFHPSRGGYGGLARQIQPLSADGGRRGVAQGTTYIVTGGAGALVNPLFVAHVEGSAASSNNLHYLVGDVQDGRLTLAVRDCGGQLLAPHCQGNLETVVFEKPTSPCWPAATPDAGTPAPDAGTPAPDAGAPAADAGSADAGATPAVPDAGTVPADSGPGATGNETPGPTGTAAETDSGWGCDCSSAGALPLLALALLVPALLLRRRAAGRR